MVMTEHRLKDYRVVLTRPVRRSRQLEEKLIAHGAQVVSLPTLVIEPTAIEPITEERMATYDKVIFVSQYAVEYAFSQAAITSLDMVEVVAVGNATATALAQHGYPPSIIAPPPSGSESLLSLKSMQGLAGQAVLIVRAETGREWLAQQLTKQGASVRYLAVYRRQCPDYGPKSLNEAATADCSIVTSVQGLTNLLQLVPSVVQQTLIVLSQRIAEVAKQAGCQKVIVTETASDNAIIAAMLEMRE